MAEGSLIAALIPASSQSMKGLVLDVLLPAEGGGDQEDAMTARRDSTYALRLPLSIKSEAEKLAALDGTSLNHFVATAVAKKVAALRTASYFLERRAGVDWEAFDRLMGREGGVRPREGDEVEA